MNRTLTAVFALWCGFLGAAPVLVPAPREIKLNEGLCRSPKVEVSIDKSLPAEGYRLEVTASGAKIAAADGAGELYARQTLKQLAVVDAGGEAWPCCTIRDWPEFPWRGVLVDEGRHFFGKEAILKMIDAMVYHKLNVLHWHLTEDQGWRIDFPRWPELVKWGASRHETEGDGKPYGPFFYTVDEIREIVEYAHKRNVKLVPEIEIPGHCRAALAAYPEFSCLGNELARNPDTTFGIKRELYCVGNDDAIRFLESILDDTCELFKYSDIIHIGGDECPRERWELCPKCRERMKKEGLKSAAELQVWITKHFTRYLAAKGKRAVGWDEILEGGLPKGACVMSWRGTAGALEAASNGVDTVVCPSSHVYLDGWQVLPDDPWQCGGNRPLKHIYSFDPAAGIPASQRHHVLGSQGLLWSENIRRPDELMWKGFPRLCAVAEVLWTYDSKRDYNEFAKRVGAHIPRLRAMGINSAPTPEGFPVNTAQVPVPAGDDRGYDWMQRHRRLTAKQSSWISRPEVVFLGDDVIHGWAGRGTIGEYDDSQIPARWREAFSDYRTLNFGFAGDRTENILWRLENGEFDHMRPKVVVVMAGVNNTGCNTPEETVQAVRKILGIVRKRLPKAQIVLMGLLPCFEPDSPRRAEAEKINMLLGRVPKNGFGENVHYVEIWDRFLGAGGEIPRSLLSDGLNPTDEGYRILTKAVRPYIEKYAEKAR
jgi:lysophospholipase L1-like esterase